MDRPRDNGVMMDMMHMAMSSTVVPHRQVVAAGMLGRVTALLRGRFTVRRVVSLRGHLARVIGNGVVFTIIVAVIAVVVVGTAHDNLRPPWLSSRRPLAGVPRSQC